MIKDKFFRKSDWIACAATFIISLIVYVLTLQPTVGLEDSGELIVASDYLGVPHPPGYPIWTLLTWFFQWVFHGVTFHGHPNPAFGVNLFSAVSGAAACGVLALLISRSGMDLLRSLKAESETLGEKTESLFCCAAGIAGGLLLAFGQGMWSQSVITEVYALNIFFQSLVLLFLYRWVVAPEERVWLFLCAFTLGLGITNHQTIMFMGFAVAIAILFRDIKLFRDFAIVGIIFLVLILCFRLMGSYAEALQKKIPEIASIDLRLHAAAKHQAILGSLWDKGWHYAGFWLFLTAMIAIPVLVAVTPKGRNIAIITACFALLFIFIDSTGKRQEKRHEELTEKAKISQLTTAEHQEMLDVANGKYLRIWKQDVSVNNRDFTFKGFSNPTFTTCIIYLLAIPGLLLLRLPNAKAVCATILMMEIGLAFYLYMPFASEQNPPMNWGYPRTWQGFMHAITRGQYERVTLANVFSITFLHQVLSYFRDLRSQFYGPVALLAVIPFFFCWKVGKRNIAWLVTTLVAFISVGIMFMILQNPKTDIQTLFIGRVQYIQSHAIYATWLGYGLLLLMAFLETKVHNNRWTKIGGVALVLLLPFALIHKNYTSDKQLKVVGGSEQNGHDFGWQFGNWQLQGVEGIKEDLKYWYPDEAEFEKQWAAYPNKAYPPPMGRNAIFFGGTDPGRFVPTYMIYSAKVRPDVYLITQNALADNTYMNVMRDLYGDQIWIPTPEDNSRAFQQYVDGVKSGAIQAGADVTTEGGRVQVQGVGGVMKINGFLSKMIFDHNQYITEPKNDDATRPSGCAAVYEDPQIDPNTGLPPTRDFFVEESYVLPWMYPYLTPHGLIMKINNQPTPLTEEMIKNDTDFWNWYCDRLLNDQKFIRDIVARKTFSKLRSALAGLYAAKGRPKEAEAAFRQAVALYDLSPEATFRLVQLIAQEGRFDEALSILDGFAEKDPKNDKVIPFRNQIQKLQEADIKRLQLEEKLKTGNIQFPDAMSLINVYLSMGRGADADRLAMSLINTKSIQPLMLLQLASQMTQSRRFHIAEQAIHAYPDHASDPKTAQLLVQLAQQMLQSGHTQGVEVAIKKYTQVQPKDPNGWINLAAYYLSTKQQQPLFDSLKTAVSLGGDPAKNSLRKDTRFNAIRNTKEFKELVPPPAPLNIPIGL